MAEKKWLKMFPIANYGEFNLDFLLEKYGEQDDRIKKVEEKNAEQDDRLDEDDTLIANLRADLTTETNQRTAADTALSDRITAEVAARIAGDNTLQGNITAEATARSNADTALQNAINSEATARSNADTTLQNNINSEAGTRASADTALQNAINGKYSVVEISVGDQGWELSGANALDVFDITKTVLLKDIYSGYYYARINYEDHNPTIMATFEFIEGTPSPILVTYPHLVVRGFQITSTDNGATIYKIQQFTTHLLDASNEVVANDSTGTAGGDLTSLKVGNTSYTVPQGGQGTTVVANPSGSATDTLTKLQVGSTIYGVTGGGSSTLLNNKCLGYNVTTNTLTYGHIVTLVSGQTNYYIDGDVNGADTEDICENFGYLYDNNNSMLLLPENPSCPALFAYTTSSVGQDGHSVAIFENIVNPLKIEYNKYDTLRFDFNYLSGSPKTLSRRHIVITNFMGGGTPHAVAVSDTTGVTSAVLTAAPNPYQPDVKNYTTLFSNLEPGTYLVNFNMFWTVSGTDTDAITSIFELAPTSSGLLTDPETVRLPILRNKDGNIVFNGQAIVNCYGGTLLMSILASNSTNNFEYTLNDTTSSLRVQKLY